MAVAARTGTLRDYSPGRQQDTSPACLIVAARRALYEPALMPRPGIFFVFDFVKQERRAGFPLCKVGSGADEVRDPQRKVNSGPLRAFAVGDLDRSLSCTKRYSFERFAIFAEAWDGSYWVVEIERCSEFCGNMFGLSSLVYPVCFAATHPCHQLWKYNNTFCFI